MEKKRKIWVRIGAFMAALICCVICVVPAYAEETETAEEDLAATIAEQQEKLNTMLRPIGYEIDYDVYLYSAGKTYNDILAVGEIDSDFPTYANTEAVWRSGTLYTTYRVWVRIADAGNNTIVSFEADASFLTLENPSTGENPIKFGFNNPVQGYSRVNVIHNSNGEWTAIEIGDISAVTRYAVADGYHFHINYISTSVKINPWYNLFCSKSWTCNPSMLLALDTSIGGDAAYNEGYANGYDEGYSTGNDSGYRTGYDDGMHQTSLIEGIKSLFRAPMEFIESVLDFEIFGIDLGDAVKALVSMMLLALVITVVWKAVK